MNKNASSKRIIFAIVIIVVSLIFDQVTKQVAHENLPRWERISYLGDTLRLQYAENSGAAFSLGSELPENWRWFIFGVGQGIFLLILAIYLFRNREQAAIQFYGFVLILGGGLGNFLDRLYRDGVVVDFLNVGIGTIRTAIFNVADISISAGLLLLIWSMLNQSREEGTEANTLDALDDELQASTKASEGPSFL